jgi:Ca2+-binding RTX toxin-like protein
MTVYEYYGNSGDNDFDLTTHPLYSWYYNQLSASAGEGNDTIYGGENDDTLNGGSGNDSIKVRIY